MHWSPSSLLDYEACPALFYRRRVLRLPEPPSPALERGNVVHRLLEDHVRLSKPLPSEFGAWEQMLVDLKSGPQLYAEENWVLNDRWAREVDRSKAWAWLKTDLHWLDGDHLSVVDYKTGRIYADKHRDQFRIYAVAGAMLYPSVTRVTVEGWYIDQNEIKQDEYDADELRDKHREEIEERARRVLVAAADPATERDERPGDVCRYCPFSQRKGGPCTSA
jgi:CRISPR/Cas system-associated exonuclease Cas4 (RecB family)